MKEWALKHPWMTFFLLDSAIAGVVKIITCFTGAVNKAVEVAVEPVEVSVETEYGEESEA